jgi:hypothetical protein
LIGYTIVAGQSTQCESVPGVPLNYSLVAVTQLRSFFCGSLGQKSTPFNHQKICICDFGRLQMDSNKGGSKKPTMQASTAMLKKANSKKVFYRLLCI